ncbi:hypothetical protein ACHQM5_022467 [Ranunculus cassubicifolius]
METASNQHLLADEQLPSVVDNIERDEELEEDDIDDEEIEEENEEEFQLSFQGEMNPLDFIENDALGFQPYQQFQRLEYEALADKKRKALSNRQQSDGSAKKSRIDDDDSLLTSISIDEIMEGMGMGRRRKSRRKDKKKGRRKGTKNKLSPEISRKLGEANLYYAKRQYEEAILVLKEVVMLAPNLSETYHTLGLVYEEIGDEKKSMNFYMLAAHLAPKDHPSLWKRLYALSIKQQNIGQAIYCLSKAIKTDPEDTNLRFNRATLYVELGEYQKAADTYHEIVELYPENVDARMMAAKMYKACNQVDQSISVLENYVKDHPVDADTSLISLLATMHMENHDHDRALQHIENARSLYYMENQMPTDLTVKAGICKVHLGNVEEAEILFGCLQSEHANDMANLIIDAADTLMGLGHYQNALKYYFMLEGKNELLKGSLHLKIAKCYSSLTERVHAIIFYQKALSAMEDNIDARVTLASLLVEEGREEEAITLLSPPEQNELAISTSLNQSKPWWVSGKVKMLLAKIYHAQGMLEEFVNAILPSVTEALSVESFNQKARRRKTLTTSILCERVKVLDENRVDFIFRGFRPLAPPSELLKAVRAKKALQKKAALKEEKKAAVLAAGLDWYSDDSDDDDSPRVRRESPLPMLLQDNQHHQLIINLCKALTSLRRYWDALKILQDTQRLAVSTLSSEKKEELRSLEAQIAFNISDPTYAFEDARSTVKQHPNSIAAWNYYYKVISRSVMNLSKPSKFLNHMRRVHTKCLPPIIISGHKLTMISQHQSAARKYLQAYKLQPDSPFLNLCVGTALINLALGFRLQNKHQCLAQGFAFLYNNLRLSGNNQEALYNIARAYQHVGLVTLAASYYEKVIATPEKDYPLPKMPIEDCSSRGLGESRGSGYCNLRREAAYNLHLIYKNSGAFDLARQVLKYHCTL